MTTDQQARNIIIIGGGIIGSTTAYFLSHHPSFNPQRDRITLLEATEIAGGASGKAGGLLALWAYPDCIVPLSYKLHQDLAEKYGGAERWGYRALHCGQVEARGVLTKPKDEDNKISDNEDAVSLQKRSPKIITQLRAAGVPQDLDWIAADGLKCYEEMGTPLTTAQVHPYQFTTSMAQLAQEKGVKIIYGTATSIEQQDNSKNGAVTAVTYTTNDSPIPHRITADTVLLTAGPWTKTLYPSAPISALRAHSITIRPSRPISAYALFTTIELPQHDQNNNNNKPKTSTTNTAPTPTPTIVTPEIYPRPNNQVYACGATDTLTPLPPSSHLVQCNDAACTALYAHVASIAPPLRNGRVTARQACYLPIVSPAAGRGGVSKGGVEGELEEEEEEGEEEEGGGPLIGRTSIPGLLMGAGHSCWGIQNAPATGLLLAELVFDGEVKSARIGGLDPRRYEV